MTHMLWMNFSCDPWQAMPLIEMWGETGAVLYSTGKGQGPSDCQMIIVRYPCADHD